MSRRHPSTLLPWATAGVLLLLSVLVAVAASAGSRDSEPPAAVEARDPSDTALAAPDSVDPSAGRPVRPEVHESSLRVRIDVRDIGRLLPAPPVPLEAVVQRGADPRSATRLAARLRYRAGPATIGAGGPSPRGRNLAQFDLGGNVAGSPFCRVVDADFAVAGQPLVVRDDVVVTGRVLGAANGQPVAGAVVWCGALDAAGSRTDTVRTGDDGTFEQVVSFGSRGIPVVVEGDGIASTYRIVDGLSDARVELRIVAQPANTIEVQLGARVADPSRGRLVLIPASDDSGLRDYPFFLAAFDPSLRALDARGFRAVDDLPSSGRLRATVLHPALALVRDVTIQLGAEKAMRRATVVPAPDLPGSSTARRKRGRRAFELRSRIVAAGIEGAPLAHARVELVSASMREDSTCTWRLLPPTSYRTGRVGFADADGVVDFAVFAEPGREWLRISAEGFCGLEVELDDEGLPERIALPPAGAVAFDDMVEPRLGFRLEPEGRRFQLRVSDSPRSTSGGWQPWLDFEAYEWPLDGPRMVGFDVFVDPGDGSAERHVQVAPVPIDGVVRFDVDSHEARVSR